MSKQSNSNHFSYSVSLFAYNTLSYAAAPFAVARLHRLAKKHPGYSENIQQRFGRITVASKKRKILWLHAVSVGEVIASEPLVRGLLEQFSSLSICITTTTPTGVEQVGRSFGRYISATNKEADSSSAGDKGRVFSTYAPYDLPHVIDRFLQYLQPIGLVVMETEIWPNWIAKLNKRKLPILLANGRMSEKSFKGYAKVSALSSPTFSQIGCISAQTKSDAERFSSLGAMNVQVAGNLKADFRITAEEHKQAKVFASVFGLAHGVDESNSVNKEEILLAASTHEGEDELILKAFIAQRKVRPNLLLLLVPRHPERTHNIAQICDNLNLNYRLRSSELPFDTSHSVIICDQLGELRALLGLASLVIMGGTFIDHGGHNPLEPAAWGVGIIAGPSQRNFDLTFTALEQCGALKRAKVDQSSLSEEISKLLEHPNNLTQMGEAALNYLFENGGATQKNIELCDSLFGLNKDSE